MAADPGSLRALLLRLPFLVCVVVPGMPPTAFAAGVECEIDIGIGPSTPVGSIGWSMDYSSGGGVIVGSAASSSCTNLVAGTLAAFTDHDAELRVQGALLSEPAMSTPRTIARCLYRADAAPLAADFDITVTEASDVNVDPIEPLPLMDVTRIACTPFSGPTTTTTLPETECRSWPVTFRLLSASGAVGQVQFEVDYSAAAGEFAGEGGDVSCVGQLAGTLTAANDDEMERRLDAALVALEEFSAPQDLMTCTFVDQGKVPVPGDFAVQLVVLEDLDFLPVSGTVGISIPGSGTVSNCQDLCGDGVTTGSETCDDGNSSNADECLDDCTLPRCGDGFLRSQVEECDDGNLSNLDACLNSCVSAQCGDGFVRTGVEVCDDGNLSNFDACLNNCTLPTCGDGYVRTGVEQCDDGNTVDHDGCTSGCRSVVVCGDATGDRKVLAGDSLITLRRAVGLEVYCPGWACDNNGDDRVTAADALMTLNASVGLPVTWNCPPPKAVALQMISTLPLGSLQLDLDYADAATELLGDGALVQCQGNVQGALYAFNDKPSRVLTMSMASVDAFSGPRELARCSFTPTREIDALDFSVSVIDALTPGGSFAAGVQVKALLY